MRLPRLLISRQTAACKGCGLVITERKRKPCKACGSLNRNVTATADDTIGATDRAS